MPTPIDDPGKEAGIPWKKFSDMHTCMEDPAKTEALKIHCSRINFHKGQTVADFCNEVFDHQLYLYIKHYNTQKTRIFPHEATWMAGKPVGEAHRELARVYADSLKMARGGPLKFDAEATAEAKRKFNTALESHHKKITVHHLKCITLAWFTFLHERYGDDPRCWGIALLIFDEAKNLFVVAEDFPLHEETGYPSNKKEIRLWFQRNIGKVTAQWVKNDCSAGKNNNHPMDDQRVFPDDWVPWGLAEEMKAIYKRYKRHYPKDDYEKDHKAAIAYAKKQVDFHIEEHSRLREERRRELAGTSGRGEKEK